MALPVFIAGVAIGGLAVVALNNRAKIVKEVKVGIEKAKDFAKNSLKETQVVKKSPSKAKKPVKKEASNAANA
ncbi:MAG: hypothetical protein LBC08_02830 [Campylobacteraceae bacterium]|jgi:hypothetical protein|nr:hypothetical protein [Campylobacteraceae bacterium]